MKTFDVIVEIGNVKSDETEYVTFHNCVEVQTHSITDPIPKTFLKLVRVRDCYLYNTLPQWSYAIEYIDNDSIISIMIENIDEYSPNN